MEKSGMKMKYIVCLITLALTGCGMLTEGMRLGENKLDIAPVNDSDVRHPEWGRVAMRSPMDSASLQPMGMNTHRVARADDGMRLSNVATHISRNGSMTASSQEMATKVPANNPLPTSANVGVRQEAFGTPETLERFLARNHIKYEVLPGEHTMIRLVNAIYFKPDSLNMTDQSRDWLDPIARYLANYAGVEVVVDGHTDNIGDAQYNESLSLKRAEAVKNWISRRYQSIDKIYVRGYGGAVPACDNKTPEGKACNRRVELFFILPS
jgi:outer membrane protein OmpA-like peptidoglycan-associated protein